MSRRRRDRLTIMAQILNTARKGSLKTQIMFKAGLSFAQLSEYLSFLQEVKLLKVDTEDGRTIYRRTPKGVKYLETFAEIKGLLRKTSEHNPMHTQHYCTRLEE